MNRSTGQSCWTPPNLSHKWGRCYWTAATRCGSAPPNLPHKWGRSEAASP